MENLYVTLIGLLAGAIGYLFINFWVHPILRFRDIRSQIISDLVFYANAVSGEAGPDALSDVMRERLYQRLESNRRHSADLAANYLEMPGWYKCYLRWRGLRPDKAVIDLRRLSNYPHWRKAEVQVKKIQALLKIDPPVV